MSEPGNPLAQETRINLLYMRLHDEVKAREYLQTRVDVLEHFIKMQYPEFFAGEVGTGVDPKLNPIPISFAKPQERFNDAAHKWERIPNDAGQTG